MPLLAPQPALRPSRIRLPFHLLPVPRRLTLTTTTATRLSSPSIKFDQTKESNNPDGKPIPDDFHKNAGGSSSSRSSASSSGDGSGDAQPQSGKSTGVLGEGGGSDGGGRQAGGGKTVVGRVHKADKDAVDAAKQHSVRRPIPSEGNTSEGRGGDAL